jgi:thiol-disulfide isomerase/thioredoxin
MKKRILQFTYGFFVAWAISLTRGYIPANQTYLIAILVLLPIGVLIGAQETKPLLAAALWNLGGFVIYSLIFMTDDSAWMWPHTFPLLSLAPAAACYLGIRLRQGGRLMPLWGGLAALLIAHGYVAMRWEIPLRLFDSYDARMQTPVEGIHLTALHGEDVQLPIPGKQLHIIDFWNTGCGACYRLKPEMQALARQWQDDQRVAFLSVSSAFYDSLPKIRAARYLHVGDTTAIPEYFDQSGELAKRLSQEGCPVIAFVDGNGVGRLVHSGYDRATAGVYRARMDAHIAAMLAPGN